jgi:phosphatidate cytidylyltransferase
LNSIKKLSGKLAPNLSGGKTIEGSIGGVFGALILTIIWMFITNNFAWQFIPIALITAVFSVVGDLYESIYKRETGVKDSGNILPGHGGILDRLDGIFAATPVLLHPVKLLCYHSPLLKALWQRIHPSLPQT